MKQRASQILAVGSVLVLGIVIGFGCGQSDQQGDREAQADSDDEPTATVARYGSVIGLDPEKKDEYIKLHAETWPEILDMIAKCNMHNYSIYLAELEGKLYLFSYFEYTGSDLDADMQLMKDDPKTNEWWALTDPCQIRLPGTPEGEQWLGIEEVFHTD